MQCNFISLLCNVIILTLQTLKYAFQTNDRLCFVMEYANGGEVRPIVPVDVQPQKPVSSHKGLLPFYITSALFFSSFFSTCLGSGCSRRTVRASTVLRLCLHSSTFIHVTWCTATSRWILRTVWNMKDPSRYFNMGRCTSWLIGLSYKAVAGFDIWLSWACSDYKNNI